MKMVRELTKSVPAAVVSVARKRLDFRFLVLLASMSITTFSAVIRADQTAAGLPKLFDQLLTAKSSSEASELESSIWQLWHMAPDKSSEYLLSQVDYAMREGQLALALKLSNQLIDGSPEFSEAWNKRATIHYLMGNNSASVADIRATLALEPRHFGAISGLGLIFLREQNMEAALDAFKQVLVISPASANAKSSAEMVQNQLGREI